MLRVFFNREDHLRLSPTLHITITWRAREQYSFPVEDEAEVGGWPGSDLTVPVNCVALVH